MAVARGRARQAAGTMPSSTDSTGVAAWSPAHHRLCHHRRRRHRPFRRLCRHYCRCRRRWRPTDERSSRRRRCPSPRAGMWPMRPHGAHAIGVGADGGGRLISPTAGAYAPSGARHPRPPNVQVEQNEGPPLFPKHHPPFQGPRQRRRAATPRWPPPAAGCLQDRAPAPLHEPVGTALALPNSDRCARCRPRGPRPLYSVCPFEGGLKAPVAHRPLCRRSRVRSSTKQCTGPWTRPVGGRSPPADGSAVGGV